MTIVPMYFLPIAVAVVAFLVPLLCTIGVWNWARSLSRRPEVPRFASKVAYALVILGVVVAVVGAIFAFAPSLGIVRTEGSQQIAPDLVEASFRALNWGALGSLFPIVAGLWLLFCTLRLGSPDPKRASMVGRRVIAVGAGGALIAFVAYEIDAAMSPFHYRSDPYDTIAFRWGDGKYGEAFYGMRVFEVKSASGVDVRAIIVIGHGNSMQQDCGQIGRAASHEEAVRRFSVISWRADGVHVGSDTQDEYFLDRTTIEAHR